MKCKAFEAVIEIEIQAVTCPGVWLCPNGKVTVQIYMLGLCTQTSAMNPVFPLLCHEKFVFRKTYSNVQKLNDLDRKLDREIVYMELIQWEDYENGNVLATFKTSLTDLLYPLPYRKGVVAGVDIDLLMEATRRFPGIIAPKIEVSTKTTFEEVLCTFKNDQKKDVIVVNPKLISSKCVPKRCVPMRQKKVCHTFQYHKSKNVTKPKNVTNKQIEFYPSARNTRNEPSRQCSCRYLWTHNEIWCKSMREREKSNKDYVHEKLQKLRKSPHSSPESTRMECMCRLGGKRILCPLCTKYKYYFDDSCNCSFFKDNSNLCQCKQPKSSEFKENTDYNPEKVKQCKNCKCESFVSNKNESITNDEYHAKPISLANEIHSRLQRTLSPHSSASLEAKDYICKENNTNDSCEDSCNEKFYKNLEHFYKQLYRRAHYKAKNERCKNKCFC